MFIIKNISNFLKFDKETFHQYAVRLYSNKNIYGLSYEQIGELLNNENLETFDESAYRKKYVPYLKGYREGLETKFKLANDNKKGIKFLEEMTAEREEMKKTTIILRDKIREYNGHMRVNARAENLQSIVIDSIEDLNNKCPLPQLEFKEIDGDRVGVVLLSDWHYGEFFQDKLNVFTKEVLLKRVQNIGEDVIKYGKLNKVKTLKILNLGDLIAGNIRVSARVMNEEDVITQTQEVAEILSNLLNDLSQYFQIEFYSVLDNHSRVTPNYNQHIESESFARLIPWYIEPRLKGNDRVKVVSNRVGEIDEYDIGILDIFDKKALFVHGHNDKLNSAISDISMLSGIKPISIFMGHVHRNMEDEQFNIDLIVNPSLVGIGAFAKTIRKSSLPRQKMSVYTKLQSGKVIRESTCFLQGNK